MTKKKKIVIEKMATYEDVFEAGKKAGGALGEKQAYMIGIFLGILVLVGVVLLGGKYIFQS